MNNIEEIVDQQILQILHERDLTASAVDWHPSGTLFVSNKSLVLVELGQSPYSERGWVVEAKTPMIYLGNKELLHNYPNYFDMSFYFIVGEQIRFLFMTTLIYTGKSVEKHREDFRKKILYAVEQDVTILK